MTRNSEINLTPILDTLPKEITVLKRQRDDMGGQQEKYRLTATLKTKEGNYPIYLIEKRFSLEYLLTDYVEEWKSFYEAGLPIVPLLGISKKSIYMPNLSQYGWELYGKARRRLLSNPNTAPSPVLQDEIFLDLMKNKYGSMMDELKKYVAIATASKQLLPLDDAFEIGIHKNGTVQPFTLDLTFANFNLLKYAEDLKRTNEYSMYQTVKKLHHLNTIITRRSTT